MGAGAAAGAGDCAAGDAAGFESSSLLHEQAPTNIEMPTASTVARILDDLFNIGHHAIDWRGR